MKFSIIMPVLNAENTISKSIESVMNQDVDLELIIMDGCSIDRTNTIIEAYSKSNSKIKYVQKKDNGVYDAINSGLQLVTGDVISVLNGNDYFAEEALTEVERVFYKNECDYVCASVRLIGRKFPITVRPIEIHLWEKYGLQTMPVPHIGLFVSTSLAKKIGNYNVKFKTASDHDYCLRLNRQSKNAYILHRVVADVSAGGISSDWKSRFEHAQIATLYGRPFGFALIVFIKQSINSIMLNIANQRVWNLLLNLNQKINKRYEY